MKTVNYVEKPAPTKMISLRIPLDILKAAKAKALKEGFTLSQVVVAGLKKYLKE